MTARSRVERKAFHLLLGSRRWLDDLVGEFAQRHSGGRILEIGSGRQDLGADAYSMRRHFDQSCDFVQSDINPDFGHEVVDITTMDFDQEFDAILCISVLEHVPEFWLAAPRLRRALRPGGQLLVAVPMAFPYHDEPGDYWRMTTYGLKSLLSDFRTVELGHRGPRRMPITVTAIATR